MFENESDFKKAVEGLNIDARANPAHRQKLRREMLKAFSQTQKAESVTDGDSITGVFFKSPLGKVAAAAAIIIAVLVGMHLIGGPRIVIANVLENMEEMPWIKCVERHYHQGKVSVNYHWTNFGSEISFAKYPDAVWAFDYGRRVQQFHRLGDGVVEISDLGETTPQVSSATALAGQLIEHAKEEGEFEVTQKKGRLDGQVVEIFQLSKSYPQENMWMDGTIVATSKMRLVVNGKTGLMVAGGMQWLDAEGGLISQSKLKVSYPDRGPTDIYQLGVPMTAKLLDLRGIPGDKQEGMRRQFRRSEELAKVAAMFAAEDIDGLIAILEDAEFEQTRLAAADYLAQIGDEEAIEALQKLSEQWEGNDSDNPFERAIVQIEERLEDTETISDGTVQPPDGASETKSVLSGFVTDAYTGLPVVNATVQIDKVREHDRKTTTDANGFYHFDEIGDDGEYKINISSNEYYWVGDWKDIPVVLLKKGFHVRRDFALNRGCQIDIDVIDEAGEPIKGVWLRVAWMGERFGRQVGRRRSPPRTDDNGQATLGAFEPSDIAYLVTAVHEDYAPGKFIAELTNPDVIEYGQIVLQEGVTVEGYAAYADGAAADDREIRAKPVWWNIGSNPPSVPVDANGYFSLPHIAPGLYGISVCTPSRGGGGTSRVVMETKLPPEDDLLIVKVPGISPGSQETASKKIGPAGEDSNAPVSISGIIHFVGDEEPGKVEVTATSSARQSKKVVVEANKFAFDSLKSGYYRLSFRGDGIEDIVLQNVRAPSSDIEVEIRSTGKLALKGLVVRSDTGAPIDSFKARVRKVKILRGRGGSWQQDRWQHFGNGKFDIEVKAPGIYQVHVVADGLAGAWSEQINTDEDKEVIVKLTAGGTIRGELVDADGAGVSGAKVVPLSAACGSASYSEKLFVSDTGAVKSSDGSFMLKNVPEGVDTLKVTHPGHAPAVLEGIEVTEGKVTDVQVVLTRGGAVEGYVYDAQGKPQADVLLYFQDAANYRVNREVGRLASVVTDARGFYRVENLPEQICHVHRSEWHRRGGVVRRTVRPVNGETVELDFGGKGVVTGQVLVDDEPLQDNKIVLTDAYNSQSIEFVCYVTTDAQGRFRFSGIGAGRHGVYYKLLQSAPYGGEDWANVTTIEKGPNDIELGAINVERGRVSAYVGFEQPHSIFAGADVYVQRGTEFWGRRMGKVTEPDRADAPYTVTEVLSGTYSLVVKRHDGVQFMQPFEFDASEGQAEVSIVIPKCTAAVTGTLAVHSELPLLIRNSDGTVVNPITTTGDGTYRVDHLPAGAYSIGGYYTIATAPLATFALSEGETKTVDVDPSALSWVNKAALHTQIIDGAGTPLAQANVWLEGDDGRADPYKVTEEGQFFVTEPGDYTLYAACPGYETFTRQVSLEGQDLMATGIYNATLIIELQK